MFAFPTLVLEHCWVCEARFNDVKNPGSAMREEHHVIPRAYGGIDGPTVSLCDGHHSAIHKIAVAFKSKKPYHHLLGTHDTNQVKKLLALAQFIANAEETTRSDPNKKAVVVFSLDSHTKKLVDDLLTVYPRAKSRAGILKIAIEALHASHFIL